jgi:Proteolipid membrane potential modulator
MDLLRIIIAILLLPLGVFLQVGIGKQFWINILPSLQSQKQRLILRAEAGTLSVKLSAEGAAERLESARV